MASNMETTIIIFAIIINLLGGLLALAYIIKSCSPEFIGEGTATGYLAQIKSCFFSSLVMLMFVWFITSSQKTNSLFFKGLTIGVYTWGFLLLLSIVCMFPFTRLIIKNINENYVNSIKRISGKLISYTLTLIFVFWLVS